MEGVGDGVGLGGGVMGIAFHLTLLLFLCKLRKLENRVNQLDHPVYSNLRNKANSHFIECYLFGCFY